MSRAEELKVLTDSIERIAAMQPPLHIPYYSQASWFADQRRRTDALQAEITKLLAPDCAGLSPTPEENQ